MRSLTICLVASLSLVGWGGCCTSCPTGGIVKSAKQRHVQPLPSAPQPRYASLSQGFTKSALLATQGKTLAIDARRATGAFLSDRIRLRGGPTVTPKSGPVTVGLILLGLNSAIDNLSNRLMTQTGEIRAVGMQFVLSARNTLTDLNDMFEDRLNQAITGLDRLERQTINDAEALTDQIEIATQQIINQAGELALVTIFEADILAYNSLQNLPCRQQMPRIVYVAPRVITDGLDSPVVALRGNFMGYQTGAVTADGQDCRVVSISPNEITCEIPAAVFAGLPAEKTVAIATSSCSCNPGFLGYSFGDPPISLQAALRIKPRKTFAVYAVIQPLAEVPIVRSFEFPYYRIDNNCAADYRIDQEYYLPPDWKADYDTVALTTTKSNCGSALVAPYWQPSGDRAVLVYAKLKGCGTNWFGLNCKGRGWLGYRLNLDGKKYEMTALAAQEFESGSFDRTFLFKYDTPLPADRQNLSWTYEAAVTIRQGTQARTVYVTDSDSTADKVHSTIDGLGRLTIEVLD